MKSEIQPKVDSWLEASSFFTMVGLNTLEERFPAMASITSTLDAMNEWNKTSLTALVAGAIIGSFDGLPAETARESSFLLRQQFLAKEGAEDQLDHALQFISDMKKEGISFRSSIGFWTFAELAKHPPQEENENEVVEALGIVLEELSYFWWEK